MITEYQEVNTLELDSAPFDGTLNVIAGIGKSAYRYTFDVLEHGEEPLCNLTQTSPGGSTISPGRVKLLGSGIYVPTGRNLFGPGGGYAFQLSRMQVTKGIIKVGAEVVVDTMIDDYGKLVLQPEVTAIRGRAKVR